MGSRDIKEKEGMKMRIENANLKTMQLNEMIECYQFFVKAYCKYYNRYSYRNTKFGKIFYRYNELSKNAQKHLDYLSYQKNAWLKACKQKSADESLKITTKLS